MADDEKTIWNDAAGIGRSGTSTSRWAEVLGETEPQGDASPAPVAPEPPQHEEPRRRTLGGLLNQVSAGARRFSMATVLVILSWAVLAQNALSNQPLGDLAFPIALSLMAGAVAAVAARLALERYDGAGRLRWVEVVVPLAIALVLVVVGCAFRGSSRDSLHGMLSLGVISSSFFGSLWLLCTSENDGVLFAELVRVVGFAFLMAFLLAGGLLICIFAIEGLLGFGPDYLLVIALETCWALVFPMLLLSQLPRHDDAPLPGKVYRAVAGYVVLPLCLVLLAILYGYIGRILVDGEMPSGQMNWFGSFALLVEICLWLGLRPIENRVARLFVRWGWVLLVPVVAVQLYGVWVRFCAYGLTAARYAGMVCLAVGLFALAMAAWQQPPRLLFAVAAAACLVVCVSPANAIDVANAHQAALLREAYEQGDDQQLFDSWEYLRYSGRAYVEPRLPEGIAFRDSFEETFGREPDSRLPEARAYEWRYWYCSPDSLDVSGASRVYMLDTAELERAEGDPVTLMRYSWDDGTSLEIDLDELIEWLPAESGVEMAPADLTIEFDDGSRLVIESLGVDMENGEPTNVDVSGWYLVP